MTGEKNRYKPLDKLAGLNDKQLTTPKHDEMILWLLNLNNIKTIFKDEVNEFGKLITKFKAFIQKRIDYETNETYEVYKEDTSYYNRLSEVDWIQKKKKSTEELVTIRDSIPIEPKIKLISEAPITSYNNFIIGYWDLKIELSMEIMPNNIFDGKYGGPKFPVRNLYIEVKPDIKSFGETLRQLRTYQEIEKGDSEEYTYLFTGDSQFKDAFESQEIQVILASEVM